MSGPTRKIQLRGVAIAEWENTNQYGLSKSYTIQKSYKDKTTGEWKTTTSFGAEDLLILAGLAPSFIAEGIKDLQKKTGQETTSQPSESMFNASNVSDEIPF